MNRTSSFGLACIAVVAGSLAGCAPAGVKEPAAKTLGEKPCKFAETLQVPSSKFGRCMLVRDQEPWKIVREIPTAGALDFVTDCAVTVGVIFPQHSDCGQKSPLTAKDRFTISESAGDLMLSYRVHRDPPGTSFFFGVDLKPVASSTGQIVGYGNHQANPVVIAGVEYDVYVYIADTKVDASGSMPKRYVVEVFSRLEGAGCLAHRPGGQVSKLADCTGDFSNFLKPTFGTYQTGSGTGTEPPK